LVTCNYLLTVERVKRALKGLDCYLLVANSRGINVWCAATGGNFTHHDVISILKTSGIEKRVDHRKVILPQLAATGVEATVVQHKSGWRPVWGPVYARDLPEFLYGNYQKTRAMHSVRFPLEQRLEMAAVWAIPFSFIATFIFYWIQPALMWQVPVLIWAVSIALFAAFPWYSPWLEQLQNSFSFSRYTILFDFGLHTLILWAAYMAGLLAVAAISGHWTASFLTGWSLAGFAIILFLALDLKGSTPVYKSGLHEDRFLKVIVDASRCKGAAFCEAVCPRDCFKVDPEKRLAFRPGDDRCVQCGACIVQCPFDALYFKSPDGQTLPPSVIRKYKLNLLGKRMIPPEHK